MKIDITIEGALSHSARARQVGAMFDCPVEEKCRLEWKLDLPIESAPWNVGLIVGPSGSGKTTVVRDAFGEPRSLDWKGASVVDDFAPHMKMEEIAAACSAVGFNTIPAWMRPFAVLSNGEKFRVELARRLLEDGDPIVVDEFTSVVDRQVAQIGSHAVQKYVRRLGKRFVAVGCHYDVVDWLQPDWVLDMATRSYTRRSLQRRPPVECTIGRVPHAAWSLFAPFHYMSANLHRAARCFGLWIRGRLAAFAAMLHRPHPRVNDIQVCSRLVTLPDWQGLGLAMVLIEAIGSAYRGVGKRARTYPAHPSLVQSFRRSSKWQEVKEFGTFSPSSKTSATSTMNGGKGIGGRACGVFEYVGGAMPRREAELFVAS
jgi:GNAT superfamily N-acetyltransferase